MAGGRVASEQGYKPSSDKGSWEHIAPEAERRAGDGAGEPSWQPLVEMPHSEEDLVSIFQDDYDLNAGPAAEDQGPASLRQAGLPAQAVAEETQPFLVAPSRPNVPETVCDVTLYLAPRAPHHFLVGGLAQQLRGWLPEICRTYGWQLDGLAVRPDYLRWTLADFPEVLIREMLQIVRRKTSQRIFRVYPNLRGGQDDFWAPGYLVDMQERDFSTQALMSRIARGRLPH